MFLYLQSYPNRSRVLKNLVCDLFTHLIPVNAALGLEFFRTQMTCRRLNPSSKISSQSFNVSYFLVEQYTFPFLHQSYRHSMDSQDCKGIPRLSHQKCNIKYVDGRKYKKINNQTYSILPILQANLAKLSKIAC